ncbi:hypothetical protein J6590_087130 [Homalodisca vitripennis]|nr:hypothetical protein J6590_087130 [Homalodisca vitripennis]
MESIEVWSNFTLVPPGESRDLRASLLLMCQGTTNIGCALRQTPSDVDDHVTAYVISKTPHGLYFTVNSPEFSESCTRESRAQISEQFTPRCLHSQSNIDDVTFNSAVLTSLVSLQGSFIRLHKSSQK